MLVVGGCADDDDDDARVRVDAPELMRRLLAAGMSRGDAARLVAAVSGLSRNALYAASVDDA